MKIKRWLSYFLIFIGSIMMCLFIVAVVLFLEVNRILGTLVAYLRKK